MADAICPCGASLNGLHGNRKYCTECSPVRIYKPRKRTSTYVKVSQRVNTCQIPDCGVVFASRRPAKYCGNKCRQRSKYLPGGTYWKNPIRCALCGKDTPRWPKSVQGKTRCPDCLRRCSPSIVDKDSVVHVAHGTRKMYRDFKCRCDQCRDFMNASVREYREQYRLRTGESLPRKYRNSELDRLGAARRRARMLEAFVEDVDPVRVFEADGYRCYGCDRKCLKGAPNNHLLQPTMDHVIPLSKGGKHEYANIRTMCRQCNVRKGNRGGGEQLLLIG